MQEHHPGEAVRSILAGGGIKKYCPPEQAYRSIIRERRDSGASFWGRIEEDSPQEAL